MSEFLFLGTGAADWDILQKGDFFRRNSAVLVNRELLIDCGAHIFDFAESINNENLYDNVTDIIITHNHSDHFCKETVLTLAQKQKIRIGCDKEIMGIIGENHNIEFIHFVPFKEEKVGNYTIIPLLSNHDVVIAGDRCSYNYIIKTPDDKEVFYGLDGAWFLRPSWQEMKKHKFDIMVFDCTVGDCDDWRLFEHNTIPMLRTIVKAIKESDMIKKSGKLIASHLAKGLHLPHRETEKILNKINVSTAFDGMNISF